MHPISKINFGDDAGKIAVQFYKGSSVVEGYVLKQTGTKSFKVTDDGVTVYKAKLIADGTPSAAGEMTINVYPFVGSAVSNVAQHAVSISMNHVRTAEGNKYIWSLTNPTSVGYAKIDTV
jgi:hypothetical protein